MNAPMDDLARQVAALAAPFAPDEVKWKPGVVSGSRALALAYVDARVIQDRLDEVLGVANWQDEYEFLPDGSVVCRLRLRLGGEWITKMDVGGQSEQPDEGDRRKAAVSDALKRAAVKFGIGRYLYRLPAQWADYDPQKRQFKNRPSLPASALPAGSGQAQKSAEPKPAAPAAISDDQARQIDQLLVDQGMSYQQLEGWLGVKFGVADYRLLSRSQAASAIASLQARLARKQKEKVGA